MEDNKLKNLVKEESVSKKFAKELEELAKKDGYDSVRFFIAPDKNVSAESVIEDVRAFFLSTEKDKAEPKYTFE